MNIELIQEELKLAKIDGWLIYENHGSNRFAKEILGLKKEDVLTRRLFYWIPAVGEAEIVVHHIELQAVHHLPGKKLSYFSWKHLHEHLAQILKNCKKIAMEYSPHAKIPNLSVVDGGTLEMIRESGVEVVSSADLLQRFTSVLDQKQIASHFFAMSVLQQAVSQAWELIAQHLRSGKKITEFDVQQFILAQFEASNCETEEGPICAVNENSALPHYNATASNAKEIRKGDWILIDLWCKQKLPRSVYADITRVGLAGSAPSKKHQEIFKIVLNAQQKAVSFLQERMTHGKDVRGSEVDVVCREAIIASGYGPYFTHRTGHNIDTNVHGAGANFDHLETQDERKILPGMCFSLEPGIYLPREFGVRLETNVLVDLKRQLQVTGGFQEAISLLD